MPGKVHIPDSFSAPGDVRGKRVVLTGAGRGLGELLAHAFSAAGARVALVARTHTDLIAVAAAVPGETLTFAGDVRDADFNDRVAEQVAAEWQGVDVWIANAGISPVATEVRSTEPSVFRDVLDVNVIGAFLGARAALAHMGEGGRLIFTGSVLGERPRKGLGAYSASKAGLVGLVKTLALELGPQAITANVVGPGWFDSPLAEGWMRNERLAAQIIGHTPMGRWGAPQELAGAYLFLASDASAFITGTVIPVDGGYLLA